ncbi:SGNH/GDSL hydrolase family protein [Flammeovirga sp. EKP202]|uniref:SGNH/GDSL hydrolase family protein n=1 Tax=Flammeovirga sp. EKP202 TaxID=2770592 RepID=UPI00165EF570|nr:SGNH/GDSL hydrolase family protein [Flammeovirga sp. EKP202]MBD0403315.1 SGNH/GDSL hydrolase family protein [Flammeovirga sp. EKP202]
MKNTFLLLLSFILFSCQEDDNTIFVPQTPPVVTVDSSSLQVPQKVLHMLALGDSYTIGASVPEEDRWNAQLKKELENRGYQLNAIKYVAQTGWTTSNLINAYQNASLRSQYDIVTLLIGVNNQFQGVDINVFREEYKSLLEAAIVRARNEPKNVIVLSIPDYGYNYSPPPASISQQINEYNRIKEEITKDKGVVFHNITSFSRLVPSRPELAAPDGLHPSGEQYKLWVNEIIDDVYQQFLVPKEE